MRSSRATSRTLLSMVRAVGLAGPQGAGDVLEHRQMRIERVALEGHGDVAPIGRHGGDVLAADHDLAGVQHFQAGDAAQQGGLADAGRADDDEELAFLDGQVDDGSPWSRSRRATG